MYEHIIVILWGTTMFILTILVLYIVSEIKRLFKPKRYKVILPEGHVIQMDTLTAAKKLSEIDERCRIWDEIYDEFIT